MFFFTSIAQESDAILSLKSKLHEEKIDSLKIDIYLKIYNEYALINKDSSKVYYDLALTLVNDDSVKRLLADKLFDIGIDYELKYNYEQAINNLQKSLVIYGELGDIKNTAKINNYIGYCYINLYADNEAIEYYLKSLKDYKQLGDDAGIAMNYNDIGNLHYDQENYDHAKKYFQDALTIYEKLKNKEGISTCYTNLGNTSADSGNVEFGIDYFKQSIILQEEIKDKHGIAVNYNNLGDCYIQLKQYDVAMEYFEKSLAMADEIGDYETVAIVYLNIAEIHQNLKNYDLVIFYAQKSIAISKQIGKLDLELENLLFLANAYEGKGNPKLALELHKEHDKVKDSLLDSDKNKTIQLYNALNELDKTHYTITDLANKNEIAQLKYEGERKISYFLIISIVVFGFFLILIIHQQTAKKKAYNLLEFRNYQIKKMNTEIEVQRDDLKKMNRAKDKFFSIIAHDLKNPFNSIKGFTELMIDNNNEYDEEKRLRFLKIIKDSTDKASILLSNLLIWANSQSGNITYTPQKIELVKLVLDVVSLLEIQAIKKEIEIYNNVDHNLYVRADANMLNTILRNLISNAIKFTNVKGEIKVLSKINKNMAEISVKDNGVGIDPEIVESLFKMEVDEKNSQMGTENEQGSGLGLILCKDFVEKHGGKIWVNSVKGEGSEFVFTLPIWDDDTEMII
jgi:signal transduction histidine kinase